MDENGVNIDFFFFKMQRLTAQFSATWHELELPRKELAYLVFKAGLILWDIDETGSDLPDFWLGMLLSFWLQVHAAF